MAQSDLRKKRPEPLPPKKVKGIPVFSGSMNRKVSDEKLAILYIVLKALGGEKDAIELLNAAEYTCFDVDGKLIYPPQPKKEDKPPEDEKPKDDKEPKP